MEYDWGQCRVARVSLQMADWKIIGGINRMIIKITMNDEIALVAHDNKKRSAEWAKFNLALLAHHTIYATGTTGEILKGAGFTINKLQSDRYGISIGTR
jgi:cellobiose-specific phosphotransferase system component IIB